MRHVQNLKIFALIILFIFGANTAHAESSTLFFGINQKNVAEGDRVTVSIRVQATSQPINAISGSISFPESMVSVASISKERSIISLWTQEPKVVRNKIIFEGVALTPGFQGNNGLVLSVTFNAKHTGNVVLNFNEGALLANDGLGTNILTKLNSGSFNIVPGRPYIENNNETSIPIKSGDGKLPALPVITDYEASVLPGNAAYLKGKGEPNALTKIVFKDVSFKSVGEKFVEFLQTKKKKLDEVLVKNNPDGSFEYTTNSNLLAGVYNATPFLVDNTTNTEKPGLGVQFLVSDNKIVKALVVVINVLGLLIPIVGLGVIIYFIPWYSWRRMRVLKKKLGIEEEKLEIVGHQLERQDKVENVNTDKIINSEKQL